MFNLKLKIMKKKEVFAGQNVVVKDCDPYHPCRSGVIVMKSKAKKDHVLVEFENGISYVLIENLRAL